MSNDNSGNESNGHDQEAEDNVVRIPSLAERDRLRREKEKQERSARKAARSGEALINLPPVTKFMVAALVFIHAAIHFALDYPTQEWVYEHFGVVPAWYTQDFPGWPAIVGPFTYALLHSNWMHIGMNATMLMAFGSGVEKWMGGRRMLIFFMLCSLAAAAAQLIVTPSSDNVMIGASGGLSGLFAAVLIMLQAQGRVGGRYGILPMAALWIGISVVFGLLGGPDGSLIAWPAHIGGFFAGLALIKPVLRM